MNTGSDSYLPLRSPLGQVSPEERCCWQVCRDSESWVEPDVFPAECFGSLWPRQNKGIAVITVQRPARQGSDLIEEGREEEGFLLFPVVQ